MKASPQCYQLIKECEDLWLTAYICPAGYPTLGYGHTRGITQQDVTNRRTITEEQADIWLKEDVESLGERLVNGRVTVPLTQGQFDALVSFVFNMKNPDSNFTEKKCTLLRLLNKCDYEGAAGEFGRWVHGGGRVLPGLVRRRARERKMFKGE